MSESQNPTDDTNASTEPAKSDLVERANDALADAEAARADVDRTDAAGSDAAAEAASVPAPEATATDGGVQGALNIGRDHAASTHSDEDRAVAAAAAAAMADDDDTPWYDRPEVTSATATLPPAVQEVPATTPLAPPVAETVAEPEIVPVVPLPHQPIFVQAPEPPRKRGNRGFSGVVALLAAIIFGAGYLATRLFLGPDPVAMEEAGNAALAALGSWTLWVPVAVFFLAFWLLGAFLNTAKWGYWVVFGLLVGAASLGGHVLGEIMQQNIFNVTPSQALEIAGSTLFSVGGFVAFLLGRELPIWFGGWIARRGRSVVAANAEAQEEYQRTLEAGPQVLQH